MSRQIVRGVAGLCGSGLRAGRHWGLEVQFFACEKYAQACCSVPTSYQSFHSSRPEEQDKTADRDNSKPSASGAAEDQQSSADSSDKKAAEEAAAAAREKASRVAAEAQKKVADAAKQAADFTRGVAQELFRGSPFNGKNESTGSTDGGKSAGGGAGAGDASEEGTSKRAGAFGADAFTRAQEAFKSAVGSASSSASGAAGSKSSTSMWHTMRSEVAEAVLPAANLPSMMRKRTDIEMTEITPGTGPSDLVAAERPRTLFERVSERLGGNPLAARVAELQRRVAESEAARKAKELKEDVQERLETSDSDVVGRMADMRESMMTENEQALTYREVRMRHPTFDMPTFLRSIKHDVPVVIKAYLEGNSDILKEYCSDNMLERLTGIYKVTQAQGQITDSTILEYSDVDMVDMKMMDGDPVIILHFSCQQINCVRDQYGNVVSGSPEEVNRVYYYWAVQQDGHGYVSSDGKYIPPRWKLIEMLLRGMHQLL